VYVGVDPGFPTADSAIYIVAGDCPLHGHPPALEPLDPPPPGG
jgi:hypothetical protein